LKTIILGLGNPQFSDDAVGLLVARDIKLRISGSNTTVAEATAAGLDVLEIIADYEKAIIIDAVQTTRNQPGAIRRFDLKEMLEISEKHKRSAHSIDFLTSIVLGKKLGLSLPDDIILIGIEAQNVVDLSEECTPPVRAAIPVCIEMIMNELKMTGSSDNPVY
jgi:hydrogenase maturation protease